ncbi:MAG: DUF423 domain-containing protein [Candidatus Pseudobacter hemicellulosilyticus]|uniref:DUF423 domain-containing protein n=1 Tax=Candidatus Pseudobacter hemicellulosilyticus TaxID=3121375 RepID=A0AAJ6BGI2_9BACT|nr:MAG: DUF423 domain-containing protein [Pseudobacter sp.]
MHKGYLCTAALLGALSVALGAFGAHGLKKLVPPETVTTFETGVRYQFYHVFALLLVGILYERFSGNLMNYAANSFIAGIVLFSGSLYLLTVLKATNTVGLKGIGAITPIGGLFFIAGWVLLFLAFFRKA